MKKSSVAMEVCADFGIKMRLTMIFFQGLSPDLQTMEQIRRIMRPTDVPDTGNYLKMILSFLTPLFAIFLGLLCDLLW